MTLRAADAGAAPKAPLAGTRSADTVSTDIEDAPARKRVPAAGGGQPRRLPAGYDGDPVVAALGAHADGSAEAVAIVAAGPEAAGPEGAGPVRAVRYNAALARLTGSGGAGGALSNASLEPLAIESLAMDAARPAVAALVRDALAGGAATRVLGTRLAGGRGAPFAWRLTPVGPAADGTPLLTLTLEPVPGLQGFDDLQAPDSAPALGIARGGRRGVAPRGADTQAELLDALPAMVAVFSTADRIVAANAALRGWFGAGDPVGAGPEILVGRAGAPRLAGALAAARGGERAVLDIALEAESASSGLPPRQARIRLGAVDAASAGGEPRVVAVIDDTSEQARTLFRLQRILTRFAEVERVTAFGHWWLDLTTGESAWSPGLHRLIGRRPAVASDNAGGLLDAVHREDREGFAAAVEATARDGALRDTTLRIVAADGSLRDALVCVNGERDGQGRLVRIFGAVQDVTTLRAIEREMRAAKERAEAADRAKSRFLASASHDLRQPLQAALLFQSALARRTEGTSEADLTAKIGESLTALQEMMAAMLDVSRLDAAALEPETRRVPAGPVLTRVAEAYIDVADRAGIHIMAMPTGLAVDADPSFVERILSNLVANALRHSGGNRVLLGARRRGASVVLQVWDDGRGVPEAEREAIFGEFYQLDQAGRDARQGMGLGLSIVDRLAKLSGGRVGLRSVPGRHTVFEVSLPAAGTVPSRSGPADGEPAGAVAQDNAAGSGRTGGGAGTARTVAVIDDEPSVVDALSLCLAHRGHRVVSATTIEDLIDRLRADDAPAPDAIVADYRLGDGVTGDIAIEQIRQAFGRPIRAALLTGDTSVRRAGGQPAPVVQRLLHKPIRADDLLAFVEEERPTAA
ncbi:MAG: ATP-binding protein [Azospirillaceae bacterium]